MVTILQVQHTYKYRLYSCAKRDKRLHQQIDVAGCIWNHALALHKRYYRLTGQYIPQDQMKAHIARLRRRVARYRFWQALGSQAVQDVQERLDTAYQRCFKKLARPPRFKKVKRYKSFTLKQTAGWKLLDYNLNRVLRQDKRGQAVYSREQGRVRIQQTTYKFVQHRPLFGDIKTLTVKRDSARRLWLCFSVVEKLALPERASTGQTGGFDFGLRYFLTDQTGKRYLHALFFKHILHRLRVLNRSLARKVEGSHNREHARWLLARAHIQVADKRRDFHYKLAHELCDAFDVLVFETLNLRGMKRLWGRKVSDLGFGKFLDILAQVALKRGVRLLFVGRFEPTSQRCSSCGHAQSIALRERTFRCDVCGLVLDRDHNAAKNIVCLGASKHAGRGAVSLAQASHPV